MRSETLKFVARVRTANKNRCGFPEGSLLEQHNTVMLVLPCKLRDGIQRKFIDLLASFPNTLSKSDSVLRSFTRHRRRSNMLTGELTQDIARFCSAHLRNTTHSKSSCRAIVEAVTEEVGRLTRAYRSSINTVTCNSSRQTSWCIGAATQTDINSFFDQLFELCTFDNITVPKPMSLWV